MTTNQADRLSELIDELRRVESEHPPILTAAIDLGVGGDGRPVALRALTQAVREAIARFDGDPKDADHRSLDLDAELLAESIEQATSDGAAGLIFVGASAAEILFELETPFPPRNAVDIDRRPALFELVRYRYLAGRGVVLATPSLRDVEIERIRYAVAEDATSVSHSTRLEQHKQRTKRDGIGAPDGAGGHGMNRVEQIVEARRSAFAADVADALVQFVEPDEIVILAGTDDGRAAVANRLPDAIRQRVVQTGPLDPTQDARSRAMALTELVVRAQYERGDIAAAEWFDGAHGDRAIGGIEAATRAASEGRLGTLILHEDAVDHFGTARDARDHAPDHDPGLVEALLHAALDQGAEIVIARDPRALEQQQGVLGVARY